MDIWWVSVACIIQSCVIVWLTGFLCSSLRFHRQQQAEIKESRDGVSYWSKYAQDLKSAEEDSRHETESAKRALEALDEIRSAIANFDDGPILF
jgi:hypothetical protein